MLNLNNEDVKLIPDEWLARPPKICWGSDSDGKLTVDLKTRSFGDMIAEYIAKYGTKGVQKRGDQGDYLLAAMEHLNPENAVTPGVFMRMYNRVSVKGPLPVFNIEHINWNLPLTLKNYDCKPCSVLGIKKVKAADQCDDTLEGVRTSMCMLVILKNSTVDMMRLFFLERVSKKKTTGSACLLGNFVIGSMLIRS